MLILSFESSCDETSAAVVDASDSGFEIKSNIIASQTDIHRLYGGVVPEIASRAHIDAISSITHEALSTAGVTLADIGLIAVTANPGLIGALLVGVNFAKSLAYANGIPLVAVDHIKGHAGACYLGGTMPKMPALALIVSGGHSAIYRIDNHYDFQCIGTTRDDAAGEAFDKIGRIIGLQYPAGKDFDALAERGFMRLCPDISERWTGFGKIKSRGAYSRLPSPMISGDSLDFSFSGLKTAAINIIHTAEQKGEPLDREEFAAAYTYEAVHALSAKLEAAVEKYGVKTLLLAGGVAANSHLRAAASAVAKRTGSELLIAKRELCGDNAAMIAVPAYFAYKRGELSDISLNASALDKISHIN